MRTHLAATIGTVVLAATALAGAPAAQAQVASAKPFHVAVGNTWTDGTVTFYNRSVLVEGVHKSVSAASNLTCRTTLATTVNAAGPMSSKRSGDIACGNTKSFSFSVPADQPGGATAVEVCLSDANTTEL
ncbi:hypothetical protein [Streptomyces sp. NBC_01361]|uniref:hypothetical protein n=1 Tax=Streptomyces sp. NBC_01361 TaxID=2903838 RepID=UPI002E2F8F4A|nr:hypothetical protein [Streptomyces sp. NBC_01361]